jgi:hypothetical protein
MKLQSIRQEWGTTMGYGEFTAACHIRHHGQPDPQDTRHCTFRYSKEILFLKIM